MFIRLRTVSTLDLEDLSSLSDLRPYLPTSMRPGRNGRMRMLRHVCTARRWLALLLDVVARFIRSRHYAECATESDCRAAIHSSKSATAVTESIGMGKRDGLDVYRQMQRQYLFELLRKADDPKQFLRSNVTNLEATHTSQIIVPPIVNDVTKNYKTRNRGLDSWLWGIVKQVKQRYKKEWPLRKTTEYDQLAQRVSNDLPGSAMLSDAITCLEENLLDRVAVCAFFALFYATPEHAFEGERERHECARDDYRYVLRLLQWHSRT